MTIVITMAGLGSRFKAAGYTMPKFMIKAKGKTLFEWSMMSLKAFWSFRNQFIFIVREEEQAGSFITNICEKIGIKNIRIIELGYLTDGQATTAMLGAQYWKRQDELMIYNIDTYIEPGEIRPEQICGDGFIPCFHAEGDHWSFVRLGLSGRVEEIREKERISDNCTIGAYYFKSCGLYENLYGGYYPEGSLAKSEKYVAPLYNDMLCKGMDVRISIVPRHKVHVLGTPEELEEFLNES